MESKGDMESETVNYSFLLEEKDEQIEFLRSEIRNLFYKSLNFQNRKSDNKHSFCCECVCHEKKVGNLRNAETQTFETDFPKQELLVLESTHSALDWVTEDGTNVTDLVRDIVENDQPKQQNDYVYDENFKMYYSPSTGYYYDTERNLLYEPYSQTYYKFDNEKNAYDVYYQPPASTHSVVQQNNSTSSPCRTDSSRKKRSKKKLKTSSKNSPAKEVSLESIKVEKIDTDSNHSEASSIEEGEIFSDSSVSISWDDPSCYGYSPELPQADEESHEKWPPCIRAVVKESSEQKIGSLILITCTGGTIGRDKNYGIYVPDISVSREHAKVSFDNEQWQFNVEDLDSQNGTFVNDVRLPLSSEKKCHPLFHGDVLGLGSCKLLIHIHEGSNTCRDCEPGLVQMESEIDQDSADKAIVFLTKEEKEKERRQNLKKMKKKFGLQSMDFTFGSASSLIEKYQDRSELRRKQVGSQNPYEKTEHPSSLETALPNSNKGYKMLKNMGWKEGRPLGTEESGIVEPVSFSHQYGKAGLGSTAARIVPVKNDRIRKKTLKRYYAISESAGSEP